MSKTITLTTDHGTAVIVNIAELQQFSRDERNPKTDWVNLCLVTWQASKGWTLTPRGEDLLASHLIPDDPEPAMPCAPPCEACNGTGEQMLFTSTHACDVCHGSKVQPAALTHNPRASMPRLSPPVIHITGETLRFNPSDVAPNITFANDEIITEQAFGNGQILRTVTRPGELRQEVIVRNPWVLIDSEEAARSFVGKRVELDAQAVREWRQHSKHGRALSLETADGSTLFFEGGADICWRSRGNVRLRVVGDSNA